MTTKGFVGGFSFCLDLELFAKIKKDLVSTYLFFTFLLLTQKSKQNKKNLANPFVDSIKWKTCTKFQ